MTPVPVSPRLQTSLCASTGGLAVQALANLLKLWGPGGHVRGVVARIRSLWVPGRVEACLAVDLC